MSAKDQKRTRRAASASTKTPKLSPEGFALTSAAIGSGTLELWPDLHQCLRPAFARS